MGTACFENMVNMLKGGDCPMMSIGPQKLLKILPN